MEPPLPLDGVRVIELAGEPGERCGRLLADLGAEVIKVEPPAGAPTRSRPPRHGQISLSFAVHNAGKRSIVIDLDRPDGRERLRALLAGADIWVHTETGQALAARGLDPQAVRARNPALVELSITPFGQTGPYRDWVATDATLVAMGGVLSRSGLPGREPLMPPASVALAITAAQAAWAALLAYWNRLHSGLGDHIDFSLYEATVTAIEPALGTVGTAQIAGYAPTRDRPAPGPYPIFPCRDGHVRVVLLSTRQWRAIRAWLGEPRDLQGPELDSIAGRARAAAKLHAAIGAHVRDRGKHELAAEGQRLGIPVAPVLELREVLAAEHFRDRGAIIPTEVAPGLRAPLPSSCVEIDGRRAASAGRPPELGEHDAETLGDRTARPRASAPRGAIANGSTRRRRPLEGLRVLDFGVIVYGAEIARLFCEQGAEVIKIESRAFPDGARISPVSFAVGHRGSKSVGINLRTAEGVEVVKRLAACSDLVLANFKPGTLERLGLGPDVLRDLNPRITVVNASAVGATGPWSTWMGYGPLVRCLAGLTSQWRYGDDPHSFGDSTIVHPDHYAARLAAVAALSTLIARERTGHGAEIAVSQAEAILTQIAELLTEEALAPGSVEPSGNSGRHGAPWGLYPCAGEDEWCAVTVRDDEDWCGLRRAVGDPAWAAHPELAHTPGRLERRAAIDMQLAAWTRQRSPREVAARLQAQGVPAGFMQRGEEYERDPQLQGRGFFTVFEQPGQEPRTIERAPLRSQRIPAPEHRVAPEPGEHTREVCRELLGIEAEEVERLLASGVLEERSGDRTTGAVARL